SHSRVSPCEVIVAQNVADVHDTDVSVRLGVLAMTVSDDHFFPFQLMAYPPVPTATQNVFEGQETEYMALAFGTVGAVQVEPFHSSAFPARLTAIQNVGVAQEIAVGVCVSIVTAVVHLVPFHVVAAPFALTLAQNVLVGHDV
ncbi:MAG: hypothetical protein ACLP62_11170, partial [Acidimicrobiales bacterium]